MATTSANSYDALRSSLARAIRSLRSDCPPTETARLLLRSDGGTSALVGLSADGHRAVFHDRRDHAAIACRFDGDGLVRGSGVRIADTRDRPGFSRWVLKMGSAYWGWRHPQYREARTHP